MGNLPLQLLQHYLIEERPRIMDHNIRVRGIGRREALPEDAVRALFAGDAARLERLIAEWPADIRSHTSRLAERALPRSPQAGGTG